MSTADITTAALSLSEHERADLALKLIDSLDALGRPISDPRWRSVWAAEIERRMRALHDGTEPIHAADEVFDELEAELTLRPPREG